MSRILRFTLVVLTLVGAAFFYAYSRERADAIRTESELAPLFAPHESESTRRELANNGVASLDVEQTAVELEITPDALLKAKQERSFLQWLKSFWAKAVNSCDPTSLTVALDDVQCLEARRNELNKSNTSIRGDGELFYRTMVAVKSGSDHRAFAAWKNAGDGKFKTSDTYFRDQKYFYRYAEHLAQKSLGQPGLVSARALTVPQNFVQILNAALPSQTVKVSSPDIFSENAPVSLKTSETKMLSRNISRQSIQFSGSDIGFLLENKGARTAFLFAREGLEYEKFPALKFQGKSIVADFPGPMHTEGPRLIELGIRQGRIVNFLMGGGTRRSGLVVVTADGRAFPFHVQAINPAVWGSPSGDQGTLDLSRSYADLISFLTLAKNERLSVFMEMLLAEEMDGASGLTPIKNFAAARGRRLLVWKNQTDATPSLLVVNREFSINHAVWAAHRLGYKWAINLDCDFIDGARYYTLTAADGTSAPASSPASSATMFGTSLGAGPRAPYSRILFFDEP